jgi:chorismate dehydratase
MWDFEHPPLADTLAQRYRIDWMMPSECADRLSAGTADIGLVPIAALPLSPELRILPGCTIASKDFVRSLLLVRRADRSLADIRTVAADTASRTTLAYSRIIFEKWGNPAVEFLPMAADLDAMLDRADAGIIIGDPALFALEERANRQERQPEDLVYHDIAHEWRMLTGLPFVSAVWAAGANVHNISGASWETIVADFLQSRDHGLANIQALASEWSHRLPLAEHTIRRYLTENIHYTLDEECLNGMRGFFKMAAETGVLPDYQVRL